MSFTRFFETEYRWRPIDGASEHTGLEHVHINSVENNIIITSVVIGDTHDKPFGLNYKIICTCDWVVRSFIIENTNGTSLSMNSNENGTWFDEYFSELPQFSGAIDVDFSGTPFTNTLPIRRMKSHTRGRSQRFKMLYIPFDTLKPKLANQQYTCIVPYKKYRYESRGSEFSTTLTVDKNGVVKDYPDIFARQMPET